MNWTPELDAEVAGLAARGLNNSQIGRLLGCSRCAVIGRRDRLKNTVRERRQTRPPEQAKQPENPTQFRQHAPPHRPVSIFDGPPKFAPRRNTPWRRVDQLG